MIDIFAAEQGAKEGGRTKAACAAARNPVTILAFVPESYRSVYIAPGGLLTCSGYPGLPIFPGRQWLRVE